VGFVAYVGNETYYKPVVKYTKDYEEVTFSRNAGEQFKVPFEELLDPKKTTKYGALVDDGHGLKIHFETEGTAEQPDPYLALEAAADGNVGTDEREPEMLAALTKLREHVSNLNNPPLITDAESVFLDKTGGTDASLRSQVKLMLNSQINEKVSKGHGVHALFHSLSSRIAYRVTPVEIKPKSAVDSAKAEVDHAVDTMLADEAEQESSSLAAGLFNALREDGVKAGSHVTIVSDLLENDERTISFERLRGKTNKYADPKALRDPANRQFILDRLIALGEPPDLKGVTVDIYLTGKEDQVETMLAAYELWTALLQEKYHATVVKHLWAR
jgi:hypothetical protein